MSVTLLDVATGAICAEIPFPFELKTGQRKNAIVDHNAQLLVYILLLSDSRSAR